MFGNIKRSGEKMIYIGVDPGSITGIAIWYQKEKNLTLFQYKSHAEAILNMHEFYIDEDIKSRIKFVIEDARLAKPRPDLKEVSKGKLQGVGYVKAFSKDWEAFCKLLGLQYELRPPSNTKVSPEYFERLTGLKTLKSQSHMRDSGMLVFGK